MKQNYFQHMIYDFISETIQTKFLTSAKKLKSLAEKGKQLWKEVGHQLNSQAKSTDILSIQFQMVNVFTQISNDKC